MNTPCLGALRHEDGGILQDVQSFSTPLGLGFQPPGAASMLWQ